MIRIAVLGDIGSGKSFLAKAFGYPVFNADQAVANLYKNNKTIFTKLKKAFPKLIHSFPIKKIELIHVIKANSRNLSKLNKIIHPLVRKEMNVFIKKNIKKKAVILDIPLFIENKLQLKTDILIFVDAGSNKIMQNLKKRKNFDLKIYKLFKSIQLDPKIKRNTADFVVKNDFNSARLKKEAKFLINQILI